MISSNYQHLLPYVVAWMTGVWIVMVKKWMVDPSCYLACWLVVQGDLRKYDILLMEEILHQLIWWISLYLHGFVHLRWCRISSINSITRRYRRVLIGWSYVLPGQRSKRRVDICWDLIWSRWYLYILPLKSMRGWCLEGFGIIKTGQDECTVEPKLLKSSLFARTSLLFILHLEQDSNSWAMTVKRTKSIGSLSFHAESGHDYVVCCKTRLNTITTYTV